MDPLKVTNGTRCIVTLMHPNVIDGKYRSHHIKAKRFITKHPSDTNSELPFQFRRPQFPCKPCFAVIINKAQGQTLKKIGVDLQAQFFSHEQLYVTASRIGSAVYLLILIENHQTRDVVYSEAL